MSAIGFDFDEALEMGDFVTLTPGRYIFKFVKVDRGESGSGKPKVIVDLEVVAGNSAYVGGVIRQHWPTAGKAAFRLKAFMKAIGALKGDKSKGKVVLEKYYGKEIGARVTLQPGDEPTESGDTIYFHDLNGILPASQYADLLDVDLEEEDLEEEDDEELEEEIDDEEDVDEDDEEDEEDEDEDDEEEEEEELAIDDLDDMSLTELKALAKEYDISTKPQKGKTRLSSSVMRKRIIDELFEADEEDEEDEEPF